MKIKQHRLPQKQREAVDAHTTRKAMLLPIKHENMRARRWPVITIGLIALNVAVFLCTHRAMDKQNAALWTLEEHVLVLAGQHPELDVPPEAQQLVAYFQTVEPKYWSELQQEDLQPIDDWDAQMRVETDEDKLQAEMDSLGMEYARLRASSITQRFAFVPANPRPIAYITSAFLHGGWMHLIGNMWFLWLVGFVLEDAWGRPVYLVFYLTAAIASTQLDAWANPGSIAASLGASGAIAGLMGAFLVRFPKLKIRMIWFGDLGFWRLWLPAYCLLPLWFAMEIYYSALFGQSDGIAHWAHIGGFVFGAFGALVLHASRVERSTNQAIEQKISWTADAEISEAGELIEKGKLTDAAEILSEYLARKPESLSAWSLLRAVYWRTNDISACREAAQTICTLNLQAGLRDAAWQDYEEFLNMGGGEMPSAAWLELCRIAEQSGDLKRALSEYEKLGTTHPNERQGLMAQLGAARILLRQLNRTDDALRLYKSALRSSVPHLDLSHDIELGIQDAQAAALIAPS